ncbi:MAG TPA: metalloregulator ArsR/SmtB family transcription factor [Acidimicrobiales bacterium]|nr:metalloregulator ArsR/SmtB family transcription factor [Acidimicrobiales bacterium]
MPDVDPIFDALGDATRRQVLRHLAESGSATPTELADTLPVTRQAVSKHLGVLQAAGLVTSARAGRETRFTFRPEPLTDAAAWMADVGGRWDRRLDALQKRLASD